MAPAPGGLAPAPAAPGEAGGGAGGEGRPRRRGRRRGGGGGNGGGGGGGENEDEDDVGPIEEQHGVGEATTPGGAAKSSLPMSAPRMQAQSSLKSMQSNQSMQSALSRFEAEEVTDFEKSAEARILYRSFFLMALFYMWPFQTMSQTQNYLLMKFPAKHDSAGFVMMICVTWPTFVSHTFLSCTGLLRRVSYNVKIIVPSACIVILSAWLLYLLSQPTGPENEDFLLHALFASGLIASLAESVLEPAVYDIAALMPSAGATQMVQAGNGTCGLIVTCLQMTMRLVLYGLGPIEADGMEMLTKAFIGVMGATGVGAIVIFLGLSRTSYYKSHVLKDSCAGSTLDDASAGAGSQDSPAAGAADAGRTGESFVSIFGATWEAFGHCWQSVVAVFLTVFVMMILWPIIPGTACVVGPGESDMLQTWWFDLIFLTVNIGGFIGKAHRSSLQWGAEALSPWAKIALAVGRFAVFAPLILMSSAPQLYPAKVARWVILVTTFLLGLTSGWLCSVCFMSGPKALPPKTRNLVAEQTSAALLIGLYFGISFGCIVAYQIGATLLKDSLGVCHHHTVSFVSASAGVGSFGGDISGGLGALGAA